MPEPASGRSPGWLHEGPSNRAPRWMVTVPALAGIQNPAYRCPWRFLRPGERNLSGPSFFPTSKIARSMNSNVMSQPVAMVSTAHPARPSPNTYSIPTRGSIPSSGLASSLALRLRPKHSPRPTMTEALPSIASAPLMSAASICNLTLTTTSPTGRTSVYGTNRTRASRPMRSGRCKRARLLKRAWDSPWTNCGRPSSIKGEGTAGSTGGRDCRRAMGDQGFKP